MCRNGRITELILEHPRDFELAKRINNLLDKLKIRLQVRTDIIFGAPFFMVLQDVINVNFCLLKTPFKNKKKQLILKGKYPTLRGVFYDRLELAILNYGVKHLRNKSMNEFIKNILKIIVRA